MCRCGGRIATTVGITHAVLTVTVVVLTANHYWLDAATAAVVLAFAVSTERAAVGIAAALRARAAPVVQIQQGALS